MRPALAADPRLAITAATIREASERFPIAPARVCLVDLTTNTANGLELIRAVRRLRSAVRIAVAVLPGSIEQVTAAVRAGADDVWGSPVDPQHLRRAAEEAARADVAHTADQFHGIVSRHPRMHTIFSLVRDVGPTSTTVLIQGETGTGKEQLARAVHEASVGRSGPFVAVNCAAVPETLLEADLFGHEKGAFTGAERQRIGKFELAHGGTLFIDEVGDIPATMQVKLLRVLQERKFERVGGVEPIHVDVRVIAATNRPLRKMVRKGQFREDLYYRLNVVRIDVPPLRARSEDISLLADCFCRKYARPGRPPKRLAPATLERLIRYAWPGNVRELENVIERACVIHASDVIEPNHLPPELTRNGPGILSPIDLNQPLRDVLKACTERLERRYIVKALKVTRGHVGRAAKICGYCRRSLTAKIAEYKIDRLEFARRR